MTNETTFTLTVEQLTAIFRIWYKDADTSFPDMYKDSPEELAQKASVFFLETLCNIAAPETHSNN